MNYTKAYCVEYKMHSAGEVFRCYPFACNKEEAYEKAVWEIIPDETGSYPYSAWVYSVTYNNGRYIRFNTFEGKPY